MTQPSNETPRPPTGDTPPEPRRESAVGDCVAAGVIALLLAVVVTFEISHWAGFRLSVTPGFDMRTYVDHAFGISEGTWPDEKPFYRAPLYPYALAMMMAAGRTMFGVAMIQSLLYALTVVLVMLAARLSGGRAAGWIAASCLILYGGAMYFVAVLHSAIVEMFLAALFMYLWILLCQRLKRFNADDITDEKKRSLEVNRIRILSVCAGIAFTLLCLIRPNFLVVAPVAALGMVLEARPGHRAWTFRQMLFGGIACCLLLGLLVIRNNQYSDDFVTLTTNARTTYYNSNCDDSMVFNFRYPKGKLMSPATGAYWKHQARKAVGYWRSFEFPQNVNYYLYRDASGTLQILRLPFAIIGAAFLLGCIRLRRQFRELWPYLAMFWLYYGSIVPFFVIGRFRLPAVPAMCIIVGICVVSVARDWNRHRGVVGAYLLAFAILALAMRPGEIYKTSQDYRNVGLTALQFGDAAGAESPFRESLARHYSNDGAIFLASAYIMQDKADAALAVLTERRQKNPDAMEFLKSEITLLRYLGREADANALAAEVAPDILIAADDVLPIYTANFRRTAAEQPEKLNAFVATGGLEK
ncbi:MAG: hypothetical protein QGF67_05310 [Lentisphaeria bacterium]|jgi:4-amino-4-deoxy-L-arabinose transferase-like glycosyltransferase|nr:hypothetical protein [Lentisphaeria bacterium]MDP7740835.1 hypothetical protein [Lentisphaeria bacterium]